MGISESCRPLIIHLPSLFVLFFVVLFCVEFVMYCSVFCNELLILFFTLIFINF